uniref:Uncharacterized protein n=1 Tax=Oryza meridionalis TaxID=40149 RepID=A0A0E0CZ95_9ORYZ
MGLTSDIVSRMVMGRRWTGDNKDTEEMQSMVTETVDLTGTFNLQDYIDGLGKRIDAVHRKFDAMMERILTAREAKRKLLRQAAADARRTRRTSLTCSSTCTKMKPPKCVSPETTSRRHLRGRDGHDGDHAGVGAVGANQQHVHSPQAIGGAQRGGRRRADRDESDIPNLPYLQAVAKETLRLHSWPAAPRCSLAGHRPRARFLPTSPTLAARGDWRREER